MLNRLSRRFRVSLRAFLATWTVPAPAVRPIPKEITPANIEEVMARLRGDCRAVGRARQRKYQARHNGLRIEVANMHKEAIRS